ncbi:MAG TPA: hypothetical protein VFG30_35885, partial [Polyangiales bacterium]|nr:hypothetical protein [Polyangiales bacterium]
MKRTSGLAFAVCFAAVIYGCGEGSEPEQMTGTLQPMGGTGGIGGGGSGGNAATGSTWAPVVGGSGGTG